MAAPITKADAARRRGVTAASITKWAKKHPEACLDGGRIDADHSSWLAYLSDSDDTSTDDTDEVAAETPTPTVVRSRERDPEPEPDDEDLDLESDFDRYADLTLRELIERHGTKTGVRDWLDARKKIAEIREKDLKNAETDGRLIDRELVKTHVFGAIEAGNRRLLTDFPKTAAARVYALAKTGMPLEDAEKLIRELIGTQLDPVKETAVRVLRNA